MKVGEEGRTNFGFEGFGCCPLRSTFDFLRVSQLPIVLLIAILLVRSLHELRQTEVRDFRRVVVGDQHVARRDIPMDDVILLQISQSFTRITKAKEVCPLVCSVELDSHGEAEEIALSDHRSTSGGQVVQQGAFGHEFRDDVNTMVGILSDAEEMNQIRMFHRTHDVRLVEKQTGRVRLFEDLDRHASIAIGPFVDL